MKTTKIIKLEQIDANNLPELQGWKEKQEQLVKDNPFMEITNNATYVEAKKRRTALVSGRTEIQKQDKLIASKLKDFRSKVKEASDSLIAITLPYEEKQQEEVKRYEAKREKERQEKIRLEQERIQGIKTNINTLFEKWKKGISAHTFETIKDVNIVQVLSEIDTEQFQEFSEEWNDKTRILAELFYEKKMQLETQEKQRLEAERLKKEREQLEEEKRLAREKAEKEAEKKRKEQERIDAENKKKQEELERQQKEIQAEKDRLAKIEADRIAKEKAAQKAKEEKERKEREEQERKKAEELRLKRIEELRPDKEKLVAYVKSLKFTVEKPNLKDEALRNFADDLNNVLDSFITPILEKIENLQ